MTPAGQDPLSPSRVLVIGAGALGSLYGGMLARSGLDVQLFGRREHAEAVRAQGGLRVSGFDDHWLAPLRATWRPDEVEPAEIVIVSVKSQDTAAILGELPGAARHARLVASLQNGIDERGVLAEWSGRGRVVGGMSMVGATLEGAGHVRHTLVGTTYVGEQPVGTSPRVEALGACLERAGMPAVATDRVTSAEWSKVVHGAPCMSLTALTRLWFHEVFLTPELAELFLDQVLEGVAIARAAGVDVDDWPGLLPVGSMAAEPRDAAMARIRAHGETLVRNDMTRIRISMLQSIERDRHIEVDAIFGVLVRTAERHGVAAPVTRTSHHLLAGLDRHLGGGPDASQQGSA